MNENEGGKGPMPKNIPQPVQPEGQDQRKQKRSGEQIQLPHSGSKKVKNRNHSRQNHGEGS